MGTYREFYGQFGVHGEGRTFSRTFRLGSLGFPEAPTPPPPPAPPEPIHSKILRAIRQRSQALAREGLASPQVHPHWHAAWNFLLRQGPGAWMQISVIVVPVSIRLYGGPRHLLMRSSYCTSCGVSSSRWCDRRICSFSVGSQEWCLYTRSSV